MNQQLLIAGGGIGGLAAALAAARAGWESSVFEQATAFGEVGAGLQIGPNAARILREWDLLQGDFAQQVARPRSLRIHDALSGRELASMRLDDFERRYGAPYLTAHRADLHAALLDAAQAAGARLHPGAQVLSADNWEGQVHVDLEGGFSAEGDALIGADGLWSRVRRHVVGPAEPRFTGHVAYRGLALQASLPEPARTNDVCAWLGPRLHLVAYPVRAGEWLNVFCAVDGQAPGDAASWEHPGAQDDLLRAMGPASSAVRGIVEAIPQWRLWALHARRPLKSPAGMARGRIALLGDAAHPMLPYLAQGAGMALEDARALQRELSAELLDGDVQGALRRYAQSRWARCARVQARSQRNAGIFHAGGFVRFGRNLSLRLFGERLLDVPWLYAD
ncbi:FAD-dependent monooxygenase [Ramlibacter sp.]|uniref:FAD-dependent monooxygenase n=1 Tax=Ramlibacter sp. TaxID=1917967 RepID=UPI003D0BCAB7